MSSDAELQKAYSISSLSSRFGVSLRTIRFYEEKGLLQPQHRFNQRYFSDKDVVRLQIILLAKRFGFTLREIQELIETRSLDTAAPKDVSALGLVKNEVEARIQTLVRQRDELDGAIDSLRHAQNDIAK